MNLSELIHRSADDSSSVVHSTYDHHHTHHIPFQQSPTTTTTDAMQLYNNEVLDSSRFVTTKNNDEAIYSPSKPLPMSSPTTSSSSWHYNSTMGESSRSPYASTLSDQSDRPRLLLPDSPPVASTNTITSTATENNSTMLITRGTTGTGVLIRGDTPASTDSPASPIPMDRSSSSSPPPRFTTHNTSSPEFHQHQQQRHLSTTEHHHHDDNSIANLYARKNNNQAPILTITGETVTKDNIEEGYVQFVLHHDPQSINDSIESLMYVKRKFSSVPKTGDLSYTTWDVFTLVKKLHNQQIKNWSQLVGQLGLSDMTGRPQFAQRVKRWMRKYRIDCYFDYLLGNAYNFHAPDEKNTGCLQMGNYQKRNKTSSGKGGNNGTPPIHSLSNTNDETDSVKSSGSAHLFSSPSGGHGRTRKRSRYYLLTDEDDDDEEDEEENRTTDDDEEQERRSTPIVLAGSRKRARLSPHQHVNTESLRFSKTLHDHRLSELENDHDEEEDDDAHRHRDSNDSEDQDHQPIRHENNNNDEDEEDMMDDNNNNNNNNEDDEMEEGDEEDELASTSSSSTISQHHHRLNFNSIHATLITTQHSNANTTTDTNTTTTIPSLLNNTTTAGPSSSSISRLPPSSTATTSTCFNCTQMQGTVDSLQNDITLLKEQVATLQNRLDQEIQSKHTMEKQLARFENMCSHYDKWRTQLAAQLLQNPFRSDPLDVSNNNNNN
ncbi:ARS binding protein 2-domain-containing protein [Phascolomyces articulosus]|uniref:ARS binding protein 2-domain-containing protein n=1 Tax=Phascolomyces articulosus TaxID=60185 RepID=A0AAD5KBJ3_9FUNG|nr:ARS binding protein 2-domain-containing protein [Phascolomyces articulosus]